MTSYWDGWAYILSKIERGEKVEPKTFLDGVCRLINTLHDIEHERGSQGYALILRLRKDTYLEGLLKEMGADDRMPRSFKQVSPDTKTPKSDGKLWARNRNDVTTVGRGDEGLDEE